jgi:hypothetical protein
MSTGNRCLALKYLFNNVYLPTGMTTRDSSHYINCSQGETNANTKVSANWTDERNKILLDIAFKHSLKASNCTDCGGFKKAAWTQIHKEFVATANCNYTRAQCQSHLGDLKGKWTIFNDLKNCSGFGWSDRDIPTAPDHVWDDYLKKHPKAEQFRNKTLQYYDELTNLFSGNNILCLYILNK